MKQIHSYHVSNGTVKIKVEEITLAVDFDKHVAAIDHSPPG